MAQAKTFNGARAVVKVDGSIVGIFDSCNWSVNIGAVPIHTLGRFSAYEICPTSYEAVNIQCSGFRVINDGVYKNAAESLGDSEIKNSNPKFTKLDDLLTLQYMNIEVYDRQTGKSVIVVNNCIPITYSCGANAKDLSRIQITYMGTRAYDEGGAQDEITPITF